MSDSDERVEDIRSRSYLDEIDHDNCPHHIAPCNCEIDVLTDRVDALLIAYDDMRRNIWVALMAAHPDLMPEDWDPVKAIGEVRYVAEARGNESLLYRVTSLMDSLGC